VFHLRQPFADFDYVAPMPRAVPVPPARDTGANYHLHPVSTGPYMFQSYQLGKQPTLVRNRTGRSDRPRPQAARRQGGGQPESQRRRYR
jgi:peptide/nickel transport system substrate-binding protein